MGFVRIRPKEMEGLDWIELGEGGFQPINLLIVWDRFLLCGCDGFIGVSRS